jgi:hypothetical protein
MALMVMSMMMMMMMVAPFCVVGVSLVWDLY